MKTILITGVGGPTPRSFAIALLSYGKFGQYRFVGTDCDRYAVGLYQNNLFHESFIISRASSPDYWSQIEDIIEKEGIEYAVVLPEVEVLEWSRRAKIENLPCKALIPDFRIASQLVDKSLMTKHLEPHGLVPKSAVFRKEDFEKKYDFKIPFPFWVRSASGSSGLGSLLVRSKENLENWVAINPTVEKFLLSEYLSGRNLCCKLLYFKGELIRGAVGERVNYIMAKVAPSGITGNTSFGRLLNDPEVFNIAKRAMDILFEQTGAQKHGFFTVDLKEDDAGTPKITEVNVRHVAFTQCFAAAGANFAEDTLRLLDEDPTFDKDFKLYEFEPGLIFLRDVDSLPIVMKESDLLG